MNDSNVRLSPDFSFAWQPVADQHQRVMAYEMLPGAAGDNLAHALAGLGAGRLLAHRRLIAPLSVEALSADCLGELACPGVVLHLMPGAAQAIAPDAESVVEEFCRQGVRFAIEPLTWLEQLPAHPLTDLVLARAEWLVLNAAGADLSSGMMLSLGRQFSGRRWYVRHIATPDMFDHCRSSTLSAKPMLFHGNFMGRPRSPHAMQVDPGQTRVMHIMRLLRSNADIQEIDHQFKLDTILLFKLLRFINSPINGLGRKVQTVGESLLLLGREPLFKWLSMLLYNSHRDDGYNISLLERSLVRARFMETATSVQMSPRDREEMFLTGIFSLLDRLLNLPLREAVGQLNLPAQVSEALCEGKGVHAPWLELSVRMEHAASERTLALTRNLGFEPREVCRLWFDALVWAQEVLAEGGMQSDLKSA
ncbi:EAL and HDOD domain-containing protein [Paludibacterium paludis]|uniref:HDOD domain-containing protein n=1 Tax=Paludibacterium paludis TaxID=1225769 RepID=A0A918NY10_9NEIS|nr:HDOD domain-containing protein [Paludibacterium paludis]GGY03445.1 hypothetical protein GCM10011289_02180 [Paludibacterium paludis]